MGETVPYPPTTEEAARAFRSVLSHYPTGVCAITSHDETGAPIVMIVGSFTSVSLDPPLVGFLPARSSSTWPVLRRSSHFCVNILSAGQSALCQQLSRKGPERFAGLDWRLSDLGDPILPGIVAWISCTQEAVSPAGDHDFVLGRVQTMAIESGDLPLIFHRGVLGRVA